MCKRGDIIFVEHYIDNGKQLPRHSFVVIDDDGGKVKGLDFDIIALVMSSFKNEAQRKKKLSYGTNFPVTSADEEGKPDWAHGKDGYIKAEQFYYFDKSRLSYRVIGELNKDTLRALFEFIQSFSEKGIEIRQITDNL